MHQNETLRLRSIDIISLLSPRTTWRLLRSFIHAPFDDEFHGSPIAVCWFTNFSCNAKCPFCCKAAEIRAGAESFPPLSPERSKKLLEKIRASVDMLYLSGGEPTIHPHIIDILKYSRELKFKSVGMSSNLIVMDTKMEILEYIDALSVSLHSSDVALHAKNIAAPITVANRVFRNLETIYDYSRNHDLKVVINCVINLRNLDTVRDMIEFTRQRGFLLELVPANEHGHIPKDLYKNPQYIALLDDLLNGRKTDVIPHLAGSTHYYETIRNFTPFRCFPYGVPNVMPDGRLCTPCDVSEQYAINVLDHKNIKAAVKASYPFLGDYPCHKGKCFKAGIVERSRLFGLLVRKNAGANVR